MGFKQSKKSSVKTRSMGYISMLVLIQRQQLEKAQTREKLYVRRKKNGKTREREAAECEARTQEEKLREIYVV